MPVCYHHGSDQITAMDLLKYFPECYRWLKFWLQPLNSSTILRYNSNQDPYLFDHPTRTSNAIEAFHSTIYNLMPKKQSLNVSVRCILQIAKSDGDSLTNLYEKGIAPDYNIKKRKRKSKPIINWAKLNDGRAPDTYEALSAEKEREYEQFDSDKKKNNKKQKVGKSTTRQSKSQASVNDNNCADVIDAATDSSSILAAYHMDESPGSFFEALEENDLVPGGFHDAGTEKGNLLKRYFEGKQNMMKFDYEDDYEKNQYGYDYETIQTTMPQYFLEILKKNDELVGRPLSHLPLVLPQPMKRSLLFLKR
jgi:hypothetical protein